MYIGQTIHRHHHLVKSKSQKSCRVTSQIFLKMIQTDYRKLKENSLGKYNSNLKNAKKISNEMATEDNKRFEIINTCMNHLKNFENKQEFATAFFNSECRDESLLQGYKIVKLLEHFNKTNNTNLCSKEIDEYYINNYKNEIADSIMTYTVPSSYNQYFNKNNRKNAFVEIKEKMTGLNEEIEKKQAELRKKGYLNITINDETVKNEKIDKIFHFLKNNSDNNESNTTVFEFLVAWLYFIYPEAYTIQQRTDSDNQPKTMDVGGGKKTRRKSDKFRKTKRCKHILRI